MVVGRKGSAERRVGAEGRGAGVWKYHSGAGEEIERRDKCAGARE